MIRDPASHTLFQRRIYGTVGLSLLIGLYLLVGLTTHDPWRGDDARHFGPVLAMLHGESWLFPLLAGEPLTEFPPLYYWVASAFAWLSSSLLPAHAGARLASAFFVALAVFWVARAGEALYGRPARTPAALLALGALGLVLHAHETQPLLAVFAMLALVLHGIAELPEHPLAGSLKAGLGSGLAFLAGGFGGLLVTLPLLPLSVLLCSDCRTPRASGGLLLGLCVALGVAALWPLALQLQRPELLELWLRAEWSRLGAAPLGVAQLPRALEIIGWFLWPLWPVALWALWNGRRKLARPAVMLPMISILLVALWLVLGGDLAQSRMIVLVPAVALLAAYGVSTLRRGAASAFDWFSLMSLAVFGVLVWLAWGAQTQGWPPGLARHVARNAPDFVMPDAQLRLIVGVFISALWILLVARLPRSPSRAPANWAIGLTMLWCLAVVVLMPWFDQGRSYRALVASLDIAVAGERSAQPGACIASTGINDALRTSMDYYASLRVEGLQAGTTPCPLLLVDLDQANPAASMRMQGTQWETVWEYHRGAGRRAEGYRLLRRVTP
ncbi:MAG: ArnT family glycosyltransferase [Thauera sp.]|jgi:4-amino-4-deoxy-L-arabinose transferase-like glycosyltransferase